MAVADAVHQRWLEAFLARHGGVAGTVHVERDGALRLSAWHGIPPEVLPRIGEIAHGKGMAGQAQATGKPFQTCNLATDASGTVPALARRVGGGAAIALPVLDAAGAVRAVVGITFAREGEITAGEERSLSSGANGLPRS